MYQGKPEFYISHRLSQFMHKPSRQKKRIMKKNFPVGKIYGEQISFIGNKSDTLRRTIFSQLKLNSICFAFGIKLYGKSKRMIAAVNNFICIKDALGYQLMIFI